MPYMAIGKTVYKKNKDGSRGRMVGTTKGDVSKYMQALHANAYQTNGKRSKVAEAVMEKM